MPFHCSKRTRIPHLPKAFNPLTDLYTQSDKYGEGFERYYTLVPTRCIPTLTSSYIIPWWKAPGLRGTWRSVAHRVTAKTAFARPGGVASRRTIWSWQWLGIDFVFAASSFYPPALGFDVKPLGVSPLGWRTFHIFLYWDFMLDFLRYFMLIF